MEYQEEIRKPSGIVIKRLVLLKLTGHKYQTNGLISFFYLDISALLDLAKKVMSIFFLLIPGKPVFLSYHL